MTWERRNHNLFLLFYHGSDNRFCDHVGIALRRESQGNTNATTTGMVSAAAITAAVTLKKKKEF